MKGLLVYLDDSHWIKCGIEYCDGHYRVSVVVTNLFSDWASRSWPSTAHGASIRIRLHKIAFNSSFCIEFADAGSTSFEFFRICHLSAQMNHSDIPPLSNAATFETPFKIGPYSCSPTDQLGFQPRFSNFHSSATIQLSHHDKISSP